MVAAVSSSFQIAVIAGDGIGPEVTVEGLRAMEAAANRFGFRITFQEFDWGCERYQKAGEMMPHDGLAVLRNFDAILLGAVGYPSVPDHISLWNLLLPIRREFDLYANVRPVRLLSGIHSPLKNVAPGDIDFIIVRENTEGEYCPVGGRMYENTDRETVIQNAVFTRFGTDRIIRYAFELARHRDKRHLTLATKSNGIPYAMPFWDERFEIISEDYPEVTTSRYHVDILAALLVQNPQRFDVIVASNLFGDILSDLGPALVGGIGVAPSANLNPDRHFPSLFEPVHGSAPDISGRGIANPVGQIWSCALLLEHLGQSEAAKTVMGAVETVMKVPSLHTRDLGGSAETSDVGRAVAKIISTE